MVMKQRFQELAEQANLTIAGSSLWQYQVERFGELILQDCIREIQAWKNEPFPFDEHTAVWIIKKHFGVEE